MTADCQVGQGWGAANTSPEVNRSCRQVDAVTGHVVDRQFLWN
jgi:hypothetical protein